MANICHYWVYPHNMKTGRLNFRHHKWPWVQLFSHNMIKGMQVKRRTYGKHVDTTTDKKWMVSTTMFFCVLKFTLFSNWNLWHHPFLGRERNLFQRWQSAKTALFISNASKSSIYETLWNVSKLFHYSFVLATKEVLLAPHSHIRSSEWNQKTLI